MEFIDYFNIGMGLFMVVMGWLCYRFPNMINPYGGLPPERKALVDINGLKRATFIILTVTGILLIVTALLSIFKVISEIMSVNIMTVLVLAMIIPIIIAMRKYNGFGRDKTGEGVNDKGFSLFRPNLFRLGGGNQFKSASKLTWVILGLAMVFVAVIIATSSRPQQITVGEETVVISGMYGKEIPVADIVSVELLEELPAIKMRTNGSDTGKYLKGHFLLKNGENCIIFVRYDMPPFIELRTTDGLYYLNMSSKEETLSLFETVTQTRKEMAE